MDRRTRCREGIGVVGLVGLLLVAPAACPGARAQNFQSLSQRLSGEIREVHAFDLDGDGIQEIILSLNLHGEQETERCLRVFQISQGREGSRISPRAEWKAEPEAVFWAVGPAPEPGKRSCYFLASDGLWELAEGRGGRLTPRLVLRESVFVTYGQQDGLLWLDCFRDWDGDGQEEVFLPLAREARFFRAAGAGAWQQTESVKLSPFPVYNNNILFGRNMGGYQYFSMVFFPLLAAADLNGDGRTDLISLKTGKAHCFFRGADGRLGPEPAIWNLDIRTREERIRKQASLTFRVTDLNRDGCADVVVHKVGVNFTDWSAETAVYLGKRDGSAPAQPFQRFPSGGLLSGVSVEDLDGDGFADLTQWSVQMGLWPFIEILLKKTIRLNTQIFYAGWPDGFSDKPQYKMGSEFRINIKKQDYFQGLVPNISGDFNGDGVRDLVAGKDLDTLAVYLGEPRRGFSSRAWVEVKAPGVNYVTPADLNSDGKADLFGYSAEQETSELFVWLQR